MGAFGGGGGSYKRALQGSRTEQSQSLQRKQLQKPGQGFGRSHALGRDGLSTQLPVASN